MTDCEWCRMDACARGVGKLKDPANKSQHIMLPGEQIPVNCLYGQLPHCRHFWARPPSHNIIRENTRHGSHVWSMLGHRLRRWPSIHPTLDLCLVFAGMAVYLWYRPIPIHMIRENLPIYITIHAVFSSMIIMNKHNILRIQLLKNNVEPIIQSRVNCSCFLDFETICYIFHCHLYYNTKNNYFLKDVLHNYI